MFAAIRRSALTMVLTGLLVPAAITVAVGAGRSARGPDPASKHTNEVSPVHDAALPAEKPAKPEPFEKTIPTEPKPPKDTTPPSLLLFAPEKGSRVTDAVVTVKGAAETGSKVKVNGEPVALDEHGRFATDLKLLPGRNLIVIKAYDAAGNRSVLEAAVYFDAPVVEPKPVPVEKPVDAIKDFVVHQKFGSSSLDPPFDVFYGSGTPGSAVKVKSEYGYAYATIGKDGTWEAKVVFEGLMPGKTIPIWVKLNGELAKELTFTYLA